MNYSVRSLIDEALDQPQVQDSPMHSEDYGYMDGDTIKLAHALDFVSANLDNIGTMEEKIAELAMLQEKLAFSPEYYAATQGGKPQDYMKGGRFFTPELAETYKLTDADKKVTLAADAKGKTTVTEAGNQRKGVKLQTRADMGAQASGSAAAPSTAGNSVTSGTIGGKNTTATATARANRKMETAVDAAIKKNPALAPVDNVNPALRQRNQAFQLGKKKGLNTAGFGDAIRNTWKSGIGGKAALIGGGAALTGLAANTLMGGSERTASLKLASKLGMDDNDLHVMQKVAALRGETLHKTLLRKAAEESDCFLGSGLRG